jgi:hypothetical protein
LYLPAGPHGITTQNTTNNKEITFGYQKNNNEITFGQYNIHGILVASILSLEWTDDRRKFFTTYHFFFSSSWKI